MTQPPNADLLIIWRVNAELLDWAIGGLTLRQRMGQVFESVPHVAITQLQPGQLPEDPPAHGRFLWIEGAFPFIDNELLSQLLEKAPSAVRSGHRDCGIRAADQALGPSDPHWFQQHESQCDDLDIDPIWTQVLDDPTSFGQLNAFAFELKRRRLADSGVLMVAPETVYVDEPAEIEAGAFLEAHVRIQGTSHIGKGARIGAGAVINNARIEAQAEIRAYSVVDQSQVGRGATVGPFAHLRPHTELAEEVRVGNFVETKNARLGKGSKASHLSYLGDAVIGQDCNIGAGTITCNYDGFNKNTTTLGDRVFIGSDSQLVAPIELGDDAYVAAGTTVTRNVESQALAISRTRQTNKAGWAQTLRERARSKKR